MTIISSLFSSKSLSNIRLYLEKGKEKLFHPFALVGALLSLFLPFVFLFTSFLHKRNKLDEMKLEIEQLQTENIRLHSKEGKPKVNTLEGKDPYFLDKEITPLTFLSSEVSTLKALLSHPPFGDSPSIKRRLEFLTSESNKMVFVEKKRNILKGIKETHHKQIRAVEISSEDLKKVLSLIEGMPIPPYESHPKRPEIFITRFDLVKKPNARGKESFFLQCDLVQREKVAR